MVEATNFMHYVILISEHNSEVGRVTASGHSAVLMYVDAFVNSISIDDDKTTQIIKILKKLITTKWKYI